jgi:hypothetical protein
MRDPVRRVHVIRVTQSNRLLLASKVRAQQHKLSAILPSPVAWKTATASL